MAVSNSVIAEDLLQEVVLKALADGERDYVPTNLSGWLNSIAHNTLVDVPRIKRPADPLAKHVVADDTSDSLAERALTDGLLPLTEQLPPIYRDVLVDPSFHGKTMSSVADELAISVSAVKSEPSWGRKIIKLELLKCCRNRNIRFRQNCKF